MKIGEMIAPRAAFGDALVELGKTNEQVVVFDSDVGESTQTARFGKAYPDRFYQMGIAEANMVCAAAGMSTLGYTPWVSTFAVFLAKRAVDQIRVSIAYPKLNVKLNGAYGGIPTGKAGATHQAIQDIAVMRAMPHMTVWVASDAVETRQMVLESAKHQGPLYMRTVRCPVPVIFGNDYKFESGRSYCVTEGNDIAIIATGMMTPKALEAAKELDKEGIKARVIHMPTVKPIDEEAIVKASKDIGKIITVENHSMIGGLGGAVSEVLTDKAPCYLSRLGFPDIFGESGDNEKIFSKFGVNTENIIAKAKELARGK
ncbi:MAG: transketolase family protein [Planctomycetota bacterium]|nr:MAG: transketolase family protein [Planctomycetota bacterium]